MTDKEQILKSNGSEMDEIAAPAGRMIGLLILLTAISFGYVYLWSFLLSS